MDVAGVTKQVSPEMERAAAQKAKARAKTASWDLDIAIFLFVVLFTVIILLFQDFGIEIVASVAIFGLAVVWLVGWRQGKQLYQRFYDEELAKLAQGSKKFVDETDEEKVEVTIEDMVRKALLKRWQP